ncbi:conserved membrane hypothetical protein [uncultured Desulfobacterium sp.]|uniref:Branched-chain amino acid ABC transporter permease n=1 Tax=uncultured Desulfobacterium sp. TaxID=201089 RepID=A0A445MT18_9BACT|nr:conserved membrane hypothetical protein [uncultured Desulfobacterium sp.]
MSDHKILQYPKSPYLKTSYYEDTAIQAFDTPFRKKCLVIGLLFWVCFPFVASSYVVHIANLSAIAAIGAMSLNLLIGNTGLLSLGHAGFMGAGAFTTAIMTVQFGLPIWIVIPASGIVGALLGLIAGLPSFQLKGIYLGLSTLAIHHIIKYGCSEYQYYGGFGYGIVLEAPSLGPLLLAGKTVWFFVLWISAFATALLIANLLRSKPGRAWSAIRDRDIAAEVSGIDIGFYKILAFVVSSSLISMQGSLYAYYTAVVSVEEYSFGLTVSYLAMIIVGGLGSVLGSFLGALLITALPYALIILAGLVDLSFAVKEHFSVIQTGVFGMVVILFLLLEPLGLVEIWRRVRCYFELWPFSYKPLTIIKR